MGKPPYVRLTTSRGGSVFIPPIMGATGRVLALRVTAAGGYHLDSGHHEDPRGRPGMGQIGVLDGCCLDAVAT